MESSGVIESERESLTCGVHLVCVAVALFDALSCQKLGVT